MGDSMGEGQLAGAGPIDGALARLLPLLLARRGELLTVRDATSGQVIAVNDGMAAFLGRPAASLVGHTEAEWFEAATAAALRAADQTALAQTGPLLSEHEFQWQGQRRQFSVLRCVVEAAGARLLCAVWTDDASRRQGEARLADALAQIEQHQRSQAQLERELAQSSACDPETGLHGRVHLEEQLRREIDLSTREHREFALVSIEIDPLDDPSPAAKERVLEAMGRLLRGGTRAMDASARLGDARFLVMLSGVGLATAHARMEGLRRRCATQIVVLDGRELRFSTSMGVASFPHTAADPPALWAACDAALAEARRRGGNQVVLASIRFDDTR